eukprot:TRINITY_DN9944_c0_g2_i2.p1 TRINITY_DN9944_c0_g2~~TRINITY_DN9944_c0_g2_i2.p1  ORF type:complete len:646 (+),score=53.51 TRINITY_DN9944_c0_g2_i2:239-1939(+)
MTYVVTLCLSEELQPKLEWADCEGQGSRQIHFATQVCEEIGSSTALHCKAILLFSDDLPNLAWQDVAMTEVNVNGNALDQSTSQLDNPDYHNLNISCHSGRHVFNDDLHKELSRREVSSSSCEVKSWLPASQTLTLDHFRKWAGSYYVEHQGRYSLGSSDCQEYARRALEAVSSCSDLSVAQPWQRFLVYYFLITAVSCCSGIVMVGTDALGDFAESSCVKTIARCIYLPLQLFLHTIHAMFQCRRALSGRPYVAVNIKLQPHENGNFEIFLAVDAQTDQQGDMALIEAPSASAGDSMDYEGRTSRIIALTIIMSTAASAYWMLFWQLPAVTELMNLSKVRLRSGIGVLLVLTLVWELYVWLCDPGQVSRAIAQDERPKRAEQHWFYARPVRRYDHYCRLMDNCIGLQNHREFIMMLIGLVLTNALGMLLDVWLFVVMIRNRFQIYDGKLTATANFHFQVLLMLPVHLIYCIGMSWLFVPICQHHLHMISQNQLSAEWKKNLYYVAPVCKQGTNVQVNELSDDEFNHLFGEFRYDKSLNPYDKGLFSNVCTFWCRGRWKNGETGEW